MAFKGCIGYSYVHLKQTFMQKRLTEQFEFLLLNHKSNYHSYYPFQRQINFITMKLLQNKQKNWGVWKKPFVCKKKHAVTFRYNKISGSYKSLLSIDKRYMGFFVSGQVKKLILLKGKEN